MHGREVDERRNRRYNQHMWPVHISVAAVAPDAADGSSSSSASSSPHFFCKDGRKITVGDCALFKPPQDSPPFIGVIRRVTVGKDGNLTLDVNWLYRPADVTFGKSVLLEAAPNEIFYSFHRDETPAESLLHPCKVAFLPKGVELPSGISCYVCRRVYDTKTKRLWWLTDRDYLNEQQEEVNKLLFKTRIEMHATVQTGGRSPKTMNGPTPTSQLKPRSDSVQNSTSSFASQSKGKKRERGDHGFDHVKRERLSRTEDVDPGHFRSENFLKSEIAKLTENGGLVHSEGVEKLVALMRPDRKERNVDLAGRSILAGVIAATEKLECLNQFIHLRGLLVLDEWLQEIHKGKIGDGTRLKENDKPVEDFLLILLHGLDKLPVNLQALQMCNIGKSVNHLRTHKNLEIQRKARTLVDTWKKGVEAEMNINDSRSGSNQGVAWRNRLSEVSNSGSRHSGGTSETAFKSSVSQVSASRTASGKFVQGETAKSVVMSPGTMKSSAPSRVDMNMKDGHPRGAIASITDHPLTASRDEKSTSSSHSHNNSQSCSSDQAKTGGISGKEDARSSTAVSNKFFSRPTRHRKSVNGVAGSSASRVLKEAGSSRNSSMPRNVSAEKVLHSGWTSHKAVDAPAAEGTGHKLIVKIPNRIHSPAQNGSAGESLEDHSVMNSRASSPVVSERADCAAKHKADRNFSFDVNTESWQSNDVKDVLTGSDEGDGSPAVVQDEYRSGDNNIKKLSAVANVAASSLENDLNPEKLHEASLSSINALIDSCAKYSEPLEDAVGMNLLASVAAGEITNSDWVSPANSPSGNTCVLEVSCSVQDSLTMSPPLDVILRERFDDKEAAGDKLDSKKAADKTRYVLSERMRAEENDKSYQCNDESHQVTVLHASKGNDASQVSVIVPASPADTAENVMNKHQDEVETEAKLLISDIISDSKAKQEVLKLSAGSREDKVTTEKKPTAVMPSGETKADLGLEVCAVLNPEKGKQICQNHFDQSIKHESDASLPPGFQNEGVSSSEITQCKAECIEMNLGSKEISAGCSDAKTGDCQRGKGDAKECASVKPDGPVVSAVCKMVKNLKGNFDLNEEGISADDGKCSETVTNLSVRGFSPGSVNGISTLPALGSTSLPASITVAAPAKRPFVPPEDLLRNKGELGWKGSAATSAFRPAEPRKVLELSPSSTYTYNVTISKKSRPPLDFDLNAPGDRVLEDFASRNSIQEGTMNTDNETSTSASTTRSGRGLDLDLNRANDTDEIGIFSAMSSQRLVSHTYQPNKSLSGGSRRNIARHRDFDLNDGPIGDDAVAEPSTSDQQHVRSSILPHQQPNSSLRGSSDIAELGSFSNWFPLASTYHPVVPSPLLSLSERDQSFPVVPVAVAATPRMLGPPSGGSPNFSGGSPNFSGDVYRGPVLSSPGVPYPGSNFQYPVLPYGTSFPLPPMSFSGSSATYVDPSSVGRLYYPAMANSQQQQLLGPATHYTRPYMVNLSDGISNSGLERKWTRKGCLDLNAGGGVSADVAEVVRGDEVTMMIPPLGARQLPVASPQAIAEEQARLYQLSGGMLKRKEPEGGWDGYNPSSWQS